MSSIINLLRAKQFKLANPSSKNKKNINSLLKTASLGLLLLNLGIGSLSAKDNLDTLDQAFRFNAIGTGPYFGLGESYLGTGLVVLQPSINTDWSILKQNKKMAQFTGVKDGPKSPYVQMSGFTEVQGIFETNANNALSLSASALTIDAWVNPWLTAFSNFGIDLDELGDFNFRMVTAFMVLGNLEKFPFYASIGQIFVPFGSFSTGTSDMGTLTRSVGRIYERALNIGYDPGNGFHAAASFYNGKTRNSTSSNVDQFATSARYSGKINILDIPTSMDIGLSYTNNMADVATVRGLFNDGAALKRFVPAGDVFTKINIGPFIIRGEYVSALTYFSSDDLLQNNKRVKPKSYFTELEYDTYIYGVESWIVAHFSEVREAAAFSRINNQKGINLGANILKNTIVSLEYSNRTTHSSSELISNNAINASGGASSNTLNPVKLSAYNAGLHGRSRNVIIATLDLFY